MPNVAIYIYLSEHQSTLLISDFQSYLIVVSKLVTVQDFQFDVFYSWKLIQELEMK